MEDEPKRHDQEYGPEELDDEEEEGLLEDDDVDLETEDDEDPDEDEDLDLDLDDDSFEEDDE